MKYFSRLVEIPTPPTAHGTECMDKIRYMLSHPKAPGNWWAKEVMSKVAAGEHVTLFAYDLAKAAIGPVQSREPGCDDE